MRVLGSPRRFYFLFVLVLVVKLASVHYLAGLTYCQNPELQGGRWANLSGDSFSYIGAMENYINHGAYYFINEKGDTVRAGRMPHYALPYYALRQFTTRSTSLDLFVLFQLFIETIAIFCLALLVLDLTKRKWCFYFSIALSVGSLYVTAWSFTTVTDGLCANLLFISAYFFYHYQRSRSLHHFVAFAVLLAIATSLRPYLVLLYPVAGLYELLTQKFVFRTLFRKMVWLGLPLFLLLLPWMVRNYLVFDRVIPFQQDMYAGYNYGKDELAMREVLTALGEESSSYWDKKTASSYFHPKSATTSAYQYPAYVKEDAVLYSKLEQLRSINLQKERPAEEVVAQAGQFLSYYKTHYTFRYYILNQAERVKKFLLHSGSYYLPINRDFKCYQPGQLGLKIVQSLLYYVYLILGTIGLFWGVYSDKRNLVLLFPTVFLIVLFPLFFKIIEWRYFLPFYHFHQVGVILLALSVLRNKPKVNVLQKVRLRVKQESLVR